MLQQLTNTKIIQEGGQVMFEFVKAVKNMSLQKLKRTPTDTGEGKTFRAKPLKELSVVIKMFTDI